MSAPIKILHSAETVQGGVGSYLNILSLMPPEAVDQAFLIPSGHRQHLLPGDDRVRSYPQEKRGIFGIWQQAKHIRKSIDELSPDILFLHSSFSLVALALLKISGLQIPAIYCSHGWAVSRYEDGSMKAKIVGKVEGILTSLPSLSLSISQHDLKVANKNGYLGKHILLENAVPPPSADKSSTLPPGHENNINILFVGRLDRQKGYDILISAFERARLHRNDLKLHVVGEAVRSEKMLQEDDDGIRYAGWVGNDYIDNWYSSADVLVVPSRWEGFGLVVAEAMRNGTPVICSDRGALPDLVEEGVTGYVSPLNVNALSEIFLKLDKEKLSSMRSSCEETYKNRFSFDRFMTQLCAIYGNILGTNA